MRRMTDVLVCALLYCLVGCSGDESTQIADKIDSTDSAVARRNDDIRRGGSYDDPHDDDDEDPYPDNERNGEESREHADDNGQDEAQIPPRPEDVAQWTAEHFESARREDDQRLLDAVQHLGQSSAGDRRAVSIMASLLRVEEPPRGSDTQQGSADQDAGESDGNETDGGNHDGDNNDDSSTRQNGPTEVDDTVARAIIAALGQNNTPQAVEVLKDLLRGELTTSLSTREMVSDVIRALTAKLDSDREGVLFVLLTRADTIAKLLNSKTDTEDNSAFGSRDDTIEVDWLQQEVLNEAAPLTSARFRTQLAKFLAKPSVTRETAELMEDFLAEEDPRNTSARMLLLQNPLVPEETVRELETTMIAASRAALRRVVGLNETEVDTDTGNATDTDELDVSAGEAVTRRPSRRSRPDVDQFTQEDEVDQGQSPLTEQERAQQDLDVATRLWTPSLVAALEARLENQQDDRQSSLPGLLATMPIASARAALAKLFSERADEGAERWTSAGLFQNELTDPATLVLAKRVYHQAGSSSTRSGRRGRNRDQDFGIDPEDSMKASWTDVLKPYVGFLCEQFESIAAEPRSNQARVSIVRELPFRVHSATAITKIARINLPQSSGQEFAAVGLAPLRVYYLHLEEEERPRTMLSKYRRLYSSADEYDIPGGVWMDVFRERNGMSIDIRITSDSGNINPSRTPTDRSENQPEPIVVQALCVIVPDAEADGQLAANRQ